MTNAFSLKDKVIIVTGGTGILGKVFIEAIAEKGAIVGILGRNKAVAEERAQQVNVSGGRAVALIADVLDLNQLVAAKQIMLEKFGKIDGLVNGAGGNMPEGVIQKSDDIFDMNLDGLKKVMELNLFGSIYPTQVFGKAIAENGRGSIINISSMASTQAITKVLGYSLGKAAIDIYTKWFAVELANRYGDKIRMNAIAPGFFLTEQNRTLLTNPDNTFTERGQLVINNTPYKRMGHPDELTGALIWLLSDEASFVTGTVINVDGGFSVFSGV